MKHAVVTPRFGRTTPHRIAMFRNLVTSLLKHGRIETTLVKAKQLRTHADKMITLGKRGDLHARRQALAVITEETVVKQLFDEIAPRYAERPGGYTRVIKLGYRTGDAAPMAIIELVGQREQAKQKAGGAKKKKDAKETKAKAKPKEKAAPKEKAPKEKAKAKPKAKAEAKDKDKPKAKKTAKKESKKES